MTVTPNMALRRFEDYKDNPIVARLLRFITLELGRPKETVVNWGVEVSEKPSRAFYLAFADGTTVNGRMEEVWQIVVFEYEKKEVSDRPV